MRTRMCMPNTHVRGRGRTFSRMRLHVLRMRVTVLLVSRSIKFLQLMVAYRLADSLKVSQWLATLLDSTRKSILAMSSTSGAYKVRGADRGKPVLICILAPSLCFHTISFERSIFTKKHAIFLIKPVWH